MHIRPMEKMSRLINPFDLITEDNETGVRVTIVTNPEISLPDQDEETIVF